MRLEPEESDYLVESAEFSFEGMTEERFKYWYGRHEHQLMVKCRKFVKANPTINKCIDVKFVVDKENSKGKFVAKMIKPTPAQIAKEAGMKGVDEGIKSLIQPSNSEKDCAENKSPETIDKRQDCNL